MNYRDELMKQYDKTSLERGLLLLIGNGHENAVTRECLCKFLKANDRAVRYAIEDLRKHIVIVNLQDGKGYFFPKDDEKDLVEAYLAQEDSRAKRHDMTLDTARVFIGREPRYAAH